MGALLGLLASIAGIAGAGTSIGEAVAHSGGGTPPTPTAPTPTPPNPQDIMNKRALISQELPNVVGATSGTASPEYDSLIAQILSGIVGQPGAAGAGAFAAGQQFTPSNQNPTNAVIGNEQPNLSEYVNNFTV